MAWSKFLSRNNQQHELLKNILRDQACYILHRIQKNTIYLQWIDWVYDVQHVAKYKTSFKYQEKHTQNDHGKHLLTFFKQRYLSKYHHLSNIHFQKWEILRYILLNGMS